MKSGFNSAGKLFMSIVGAFLYAFGINMFIARLGLYSGGIMGISQVIRTLLSRVVDLPFDVAGLIYYLINIPIFIWLISPSERNFWCGLLCA